MRFRAPGVHCMAPTVTVFSFVRAGEPRSRLHGSRALLPAAPRDAHRSLTGVSGEGLLSENVLRTPASTKPQPKTSGARGSALRPLYLIGLLGSVGLAVVLGFSVWAKALDPAGFAEQMVRDFGFGTGLAWLTAIFVIGLEAAFAFGLLGARRRLLLAGSTLLMIGFAGLAAFQYFFPPEDPSSCGCFGNLVLQSPLQHMIVNVLFCVLAGLSWLALDRSRTFPLWRWLVPGAGFVLGVALALAAPSLPVDHLATQLTPSREVADLRIDEIIPELQEGRHLVLLIDRADEQTCTDVGRVNELLAMVPGAATAVWGLAEESPELESQFFWQCSPYFEVRGAPWGVLKPLYRTMPRSFLVEDGTITGVWNEVPSEAALTAFADEGGE